MSEHAAQLAGKFEAVNGEFIDVVTGCSTSNGGGQARVKVGPSALSLITPQEVTGVHRTPLGVRFRKE